MNNDIRNTNGNGELVDTGHSVSRKPYLAPEITFIEDLEVVAGTCTNGKTTGGGPTCAQITNS